MGFDSYTLRRRLALLLQTARKKAGISSTEAARYLGVNQSTISRMETAQLPVTERQLAILASCYSIQEAERESWRQMLLDAGNGDQWWNGPVFAQYLTKTYAELIEVEDAASVLTSTHLHLMPGLLQTSEYCRAMCRSSPLDLSEDQVEAQVEIRRMRQRRLEPEDGSPLRCTFFLPEAVLDYQYGSDSMHKDQLVYLREMCDHPQIDLRLIPNAHMFDFMACDLYEFPNGDAPMAYGESFLTTAVIEKGYPFNTQRIRAMIAMAQRRALSPDASSTMIEQRITNG